MAIVKGTGKNDTLNDPGDVTNGYDNTILGYGGDDTIYINKGNDTVEGGDGNDKIYASWSEDIEIGRDQGDFGNLVAVRGETYSDTLDGNDGNDLISLAAGHSFADGGEGPVMVVVPVVARVPSLVTCRV